MNLFHHKINFTKRLFTLIIISLISYSVATAYTGNIQDHKKIDTITSKIESIISKKGENYRPKFIKALKKYNKNKSNRLNYIISSIIDELDSKNLYKVIEVIDGDTIKIIYNGSGVTVRLLGIDTPEKFTTRTGYKECYGEESSDYTIKTLSGQMVNVIFDYTQDKTDKYGRLLAHIKIKEGELFQNLSIKNGYGFYYLYEFPTKFDESYKKSQEYAKDMNLGVWKYCEGKRMPLSEIPTTNSGIQTTGQVLMPNYSCEVKKTYCNEMITCDEAKYYLNTCGIQRIDADSDGIPCESLCQ